MSPNTNEVLLLSVSLHCGMSCSSSVHNSGPFPWSVVAVHSLLGLIILPSFCPSRPFGPHWSSSLLSPLLFFQDSPSTVSCSHPCSGVKKPLPLEPPLLDALAVRRSERGGKAGRFAAASFRDQSRYNSLAASAVSQMGRKNWHAHSDLCGFPLALRFFSIWLSSCRTT